MSRFKFLTFLFILAQVFVANAHDASLPFAKYYCDVNTQIYDIEDPNVRCNSSIAVVASFFEGEENSKSYGKAGLQFNTLTNNRANEKGECVGKGGSAPQSRWHLDGYNLKVGMDNRSSVFVNDGTNIVVKETVGQTIYQIEYNIPFGVLKYFKSRNGTIDLKSFRQFTSCKPFDVHKTLPDGVQQ